MLMLDLRILLKFLVHSVRFYSVFQKPEARQQTNLIGAQAAAILPFL